MLVVPFGRARSSAWSWSSRPRASCRPRSGCSRRCARSSRGSPSRARGAGALRRRRVLLDAGPRARTSCCRRARRSASAVASAARSARPRHRAVGAVAAAGARAHRRPAGRVGAVARGRCAPKAPRCERMLLHGVTASGKTEVYLRAGAAAIEQGRGAIVMVPEIALTPQIVARFVARFGETVAVLHSQLTPAQRYSEWRRLREGEARVCVGPRSAVFAPVGELGLIVVDEEHDASYKHEGDPRYDAREVAAERARRAGALLLLGSATPRPETVHRRSPRLELAAARRRAAVAAGRGARHARPANGPAPRDVRRARRGPRPGWQGDRAAQPAGLVELPLLPLLRARLDLPGMRRRARPAPRGRLRRLPPLRAPRARRRLLPGLRLDRRSPVTAPAPSASPTISRPSSTTAAFPCLPPRRRRRSAERRRRGAGRRAGGL